MNTLRIVEDPDLQPALLKPVSVSDLVRDYPDMRPPLIHGILRRGETCNVIAAAKTGKSFMVGGLAWCVATGRPWLSHDVVQGNVLLIDNELHPETFASRIDNIANAMLIENRDRYALDAINLRGMGLDIDGLHARLDIQPGKYALVVLDALYRFLPAGTSENDNAQMMRIYNRLDEYARAWECGIVIVHHASKGAQGDKAVTDVGAGAGSISRAADTHMIIRPHEQDGLYVLETVCRSFASPDPVSIRYDYPQWSAVACEPSVKSSRPANQQAIKDQAGLKTILVSLPDTGKAVHERELREKTGMGVQRLHRLLAPLIRDGQVIKSRKRRKGEKQTFSTYAKKQAGLEAGLTQLANQSE
jgi:hypothetical protein